MISNYQLNNFKRSYSKYRNRRTEYNGTLYHSAKEAEYARYLDLLKKSGEIKTIERQPRFDIKINGKHICYYYADFKVLYKSGLVEVIDVKGMKTDVYKLKKKLVEVSNNIEIKEV